MALIKSVRGFTPEIGKDCYLADNATIIGDTVIGEGCSIWFNAVSGLFAELFLSCRHPVLQVILAVTELLVVYACALVAFLCLLLDG